MEMASAPAISGYSSLQRPALGITRSPHFCLKILNGGGLDYTTVAFGMKGGQVNSLTSRASSITASSTSWGCDCLFHIDDSPVLRVFFSCLGIGLQLPMHPCISGSLLQLNSVGHILSTVCPKSGLSGMLSLSDCFSPDGSCSLCIQ